MSQHNRPVPIRLDHASVPFDLKESVRSRCIHTPSGK
jgi:hypothetical protein